MVPEPNYCRFDLEGVLVEVEVRVQEGEAVEDLDVRGLAVVVLDRSEDSVPVLEIERVGEKGEGVGVPEFVAVSLEDVEPLWVGDRGGEGVWVEVRQGDGELDNEGDGEEDGVAEIFGDAERERVLRGVSLLAREVETEGEMMLASEARAV